MRTSGRTPRSWRLEAEVLERRDVPSSFGPSGHHAAPIDAARVMVASHPASRSNATPGPGKPYNPFIPTSEWIGLHSQYKLEADQNRYNVVILGDSLTRAWYQGKTQGGTTSWQAFMAPLGAINFGIPGDTSENLLWRIANGELDSQPRVVVIEIGVNNLNSGQSTAQTAAGIQTLARAVRTQLPQSQVLILGLLPSGTSSRDPLRIQYQQVDAALARGTYGPGITYLDVGGNFLQSNGSLKPGLKLGSAEDVHLTDAGYFVLAQSLVGPLRTLLGS